MNESLPYGYDTKVAELGKTLSSNIDSLNEGILLHSLEKEGKSKTIILVSHRKSTMGITEEEIAI